MFDKIKALMDMQKKMQEVKKQLDATLFDVEDSLVKITMNGSQEAKVLEIKADLSQIDKAKLQKALAENFNRAIKRSHELAAQKMKDISGLNIPGL